MSREERDARRNARHDEKMANWHAGLGRHGEAGSPAPAPGNDTTHLNEGVYSTAEADKILRKVKKSDIVAMHTSRGKVTIVFKRGKKPS